MSRALFLGDSHTCGYTTVPGQQGQGSFSLWQENSYVEQYAKLHNKPCVVYAMPGSVNSSYPDWLTSMLQKYNDIDEVFILLSSLNRFVLGFNEKLDPKTVPVDNFCDFQGTSKDGLVDRYFDMIISNDQFQLYQKPHDGDYKTFPGLKFSYDDGLTDPDIRQSSYMQIKTFFELNTHLEQRQFFKDIYTIDNICNDKNIKCYIFHMRSRLIFPKPYDFYGDLKATKVHYDSIETFFSNKNIDHSKYFLDDQEHYNVDFHKLIAQNFIKHLTKT